MGSFDNVCYSHNNHLLLTTSYLGNIQCDEINSIVMNKYLLISTHIFINSATTMELHLFKSDSSDLFHNHLFRRYCTWIDKVHSKCYTIFIHFAVFMLVLVETYGKKIKTCKYYFCATWLIYESIMLLSIVACIDVMKSIWSFDLCSIMFEDTLNLLSLICVLIHFFYCWIWHSFDHILLVQRKLFGVSKFVYKLLHSTQWILFAIFCLQREEDTNQSDTNANPRIPKEFVYLLYANLACFCVNFMWHLCVSLVSFQFSHMIIPFELSLMYIGTGINSPGGRIKVYFNNNILLWRQIIKFINSNVSYVSGKRQDKW